jgi:hypothetical protein
MLDSGQCIGSPQKRFCNFGLEIGVVTATLSAATTALFVGPAGIRHALLRICTSRRHTCARTHAPRTHHARTTHTGTRTHAARYTRTHHAARHDIPVGLDRRLSANVFFYNHSGFSARTVRELSPLPTCVLSSGRSSEDLSTCVCRWQRPAAPALSHARTHARTRPGCMLR